MATDRQTERETGSVGEAGSKCASGATVARRGYLMNARSLTVTRQQAIATATAHF